MGDVLPDDPLPLGVDAAKVAAAVDAAFDPAEGLTAAFVVTYRGRIIGERYADGLGKDTQLESWSMGKSLAATLMGTLIQRGVYELWEPAPIETWHETSDDPRARIRIGDLMRMWSGLRFVAPQDPDYELEFGYPQGYPDHLYVYTGAIDSYRWAITRPPQWPPNTVGRYRNSDPLATSYLIRKGVEVELGEQYHAYPQRALFDKIGIRKMYLETDPYGNFLLQGYEFGTGRNWARLGLLYLQDGVWNGERLLPEGWVEYARTVAPAWEADGRPIYGGAFFWINGADWFPIPREAFYMAGAGGQYTIIIPSHEMVVVRLGHAKGSQPGREALRRALAILMEAVQPTT
jgi:CubicO group peptidase (beta-lactamase class C family)